MRTMMSTVRGDEGELRPDALQRRLAQLRAQLEALDASFVRHQGQNEDDLRRAEQSVGRVGHDLNQHLDAHWRSR